MSMIHQTAIIDPSARIADDVEIGAYSIIGADVEIDSGTWVGPHVVINGPTKIGKENRIFQFASIGEQPQDLKYAGQPTRLEIGDRNTIREYVSFNRATVEDAGTTRIGSDNLFMAYVHVAHDCQLGNHLVLANGATLAGHVKIGDHAILGGFTLVHQFSCIGSHCLTSMGSAVNRDVPPYVIVSGNYAKPIGINKEGLKRRGFSPEVMRAVQNAYKIMVRSHKPREQALQEVQSLVDEYDEVKQFVDFIIASKRGIVR
ncbi:MAG: acyl-ACP--UDP-N-acetylglucosamine O-acyltransferase [Gammaproteobacteria bacterium]|nr:acyl-ACP--UDP-N-acetylglucosamine O-acyltransferase [Gammaproteobacteria bacterium]MCW8909716.1 acyl-ACP--UDP-N-acetylglucosamine O-acyltransferase [Gammaproteobacteria bacterium]MCW9004769.1 acyl-ACP--UDP-N-acetylglucosamine O-acyltransferase [Gammaproteobacteria bacterium]MCW9055038.1 acyl-ACP--UDP-N-acetylglucosamine O-acyltransferase [Gammaproteobacteria bacterium]